MSITRRQLLAAAAGASVVVVAGGAGVGLGIAHRVTTYPQPPAPAALQAALAREYALIAAVQATLAGQPAMQGTLAAIQRDHTAHAQALSAILANYARPSPSPSPSATGQPSSVDALVAAERAAAKAGADASSTLTGSRAVLLASIAACEAGHVELLQ